MVWEPATEATKSLLWEVYANELDLAFWLLGGHAPRLAAAFSARAHTKVAPAGHEMRTLS